MNFPIHFFSFLYIKSGIYRLAGFFFTKCTAPSLSVKRDESLMFMWLNTICASCLWGTAIDHAVLFILLTLAFCDELLKYAWKHGAIWKKGLAGE